MNKKRGFTTVELIIVIAVIGVLAAILIVALPKVIDAANEKSALSDAKNAFTNYEAYRQSYGINDDAVFVIQKSGSLYLFGIIGNVGSVFSSSGNGYMSDKNIGFPEAAAAFIAECAENGTIIQTSGHVNMSHTLSDIPNTVAVYSGYRLCSFNTELIIENTSLELAVDEQVPLNAMVSPTAPIDYISDNTAIATVDENGIITGVSEGTATITASCGNSKKEAVVCVTEFVEFYGNASQFKAYFEETGTETLYIKLMDSIAVFDMTLLPFTVPAEKTVRIDLCGNEIYVNGNENFTGSLSALHSSILRNDGGKLLIENSGDYTGAIVFHSIAYTIDVSEPIDKLAVINNTKGKLTITGDVIISNGMSGKFKNGDETERVDYSDKCFGIVNCDRCEIIGIAPEIDFVESAYRPSCPDIFNAADAYATVISKHLYCGIINYGVIGSIADSELEGRILHETQRLQGVIENYGTILSISKCTITDTSNIAFPEEIQNFGAAVYSKGDIGEIIGTKLIANAYGTAMVIAGGSIERISGSAFTSATETDIVIANDAVLKNKLTDGTYSHSVQTELIAEGFACTQNGDGMYVIGKK